jgi:hypothetical protein
MPLESAKLVCNRGRIAAHIAGIGILRHQLQSELLATAADQQRDMGLLTPLGWLIAPRT